MIELVRLYAQIAMLRRAPQDVPAASFVLAMTVIAYFAVNALLNQALQPLPIPWLRPLLVDMAFIFAWYVMLLRLAKRPERVVQTTSAVFGVETVLAPLLVAVGWAVRRLGQESTWLLPLMFIWIVLVVWMVAANSHILKNALEWPMLACVGLVILRLAVGESIFYVLFWTQR
jgi:hypothetical protein